MTLTNCIRNLALLFIFTFALEAQARNWKRVYIPDAKCGNGTQYSVFIDLKDKQKLAVEMMGGGACWNNSSCRGPNIRTIIFPLVRPLPSAFSSSQKHVSPVRDYSMIYFPYCNGDIFAGNHEAKYKRKKVYHYGYSNIQKAVKYLSKNIINFKKVNDFVLYGASAGGIGSLIHVKTFDKELRVDTKRSMISDSPGLHFGKKVWSRFSDKMIKDFDSAFRATGFHIDFKDGLVADQIPAYCQELANWNIGIIQSTQDIVMSSVFGVISPKEHKKLIYSDRGIIEMIKDIPNCSAFIPDSKMHTFLLLLTSSRFKINKTTVMDYTAEVMRGKHTTRIQK